MSHTTLNLETTDVDFSYADVRCEEVIISKIRRRGKGEERSPIRGVLEVYRKNGELIAEYDSFQEEKTKNLMIEFAKWCMRSNVITVANDIDDSMFDHFMQQIGIRFQ